MGVIGQWQTEATLTRRSLLSRGALGSRQRPGCPARSASVSNTADSSRLITQLVPKPRVRPRPDYFLNPGGLFIQQHSTSCSDNTNSSRLKMAPVVYYDALSPCARTVLLAIKAAGLDGKVEAKKTDLAKGDHRAPEFVKKFPMHAVPSLEDDGFYLWDSHAIACYLMNAYATEDKLYPKDPKKRAKVDQWLHFSNGILYNRLRDMSEPLWMGKTKVVSEEKSQRAEAAYKMIEDQIGENQWLCGDSLTIADISCVCMVTAIEVFIGDTSHYPKLTEWMQRCRKTLPSFKEINDENNASYAALIRSFMTQ